MILYIQLEQKNNTLSLSRDKLYQIIFEADTRPGRYFDIALLVLIIASVIVVILDSVASLREAFGDLFNALEWIFTIAFTVEYLLRLYIVKSPLRYARSFFGIIDLLSILPTYISFFIAGSHYLLVIRALRLLRIFRILKLAKFTREGRFIMVSLQKSLYKITIFLAFVLTLVVILGAAMYMIEAEDNPMFADIPTSIYWAIVTLTTVGYGDITPATAIGKFFAAMIMLMGYAIIAVPTGIVTSELTRAQLESDTRVCQSCGHAEHEERAAFCSRCGHKLNRK